MTPLDRRIILIISPFALGLGLWLGTLLDPGEGSIRFVLVWIAVCVVALAWMLAAKRRGWW